jgi:cytochrome P450
MFGESVGLMSEAASESATAFHDALDYAQQGTILRLRLGNLMFAHRDSKFRDCCRMVHAYAQRFVDKALEHRQSGQLGAEKKTGDGKYIFLRELARDTQDPVLLRDNIVNMLLAARDTTAGLLAFVFFALARRPDVWAKLRADVLANYCEPLTYEAVTEMTYLRYVLQESKF